MRGQNSSAPLQVLNTPAGTFYGRDILEGFTRDAELLAKKLGDDSEFDNEFYRLCIDDNQVIIDLMNVNGLKLPKMTTRDLDRIIDNELRAGKACDLYGLTPEHLKYCGVKARKVILDLINSIIEDINLLSCPQIKVGLGSAVYKGKKKPICDSNSYRRITATPLIGPILDRFVDPIAEAIFHKVQNSEQYGFTKQITYLMAAVLRGECQRC